jgi:hypothetical protein
MLNSTSAVSTCSGRAGLRPGMCAPSRKPTASSCTHLISSTPPGRQAVEEAADRFAGRFGVAEFRDQRRARVRDTLALSLGSISFSSSRERARARVFVTGSVTPSVTGNPSRSVTGIVSRGVTGDASRSTSRQSSRSRCRRFRSRADAVSSLSCVACVPERRPHFAKRRMPSGSSTSTPILSSSRSARSTFAAETPGRSAAMSLGSARSPLMVRRPPSSASFAKAMSQGVTTSCRAPFRAALSSFGSPRMSTQSFAKSVTRPRNSALVASAIGVPDSQPRAISDSATSVCTRRRMGTCARAASSSRTAGGRAWSSRSARRVSVECSRRRWLNEIFSRCSSVSGTPRLEAAIFARVSGDRSLLRMMSPCRSRNAGVRYRRSRPARRHSALQKRARSGVPPAQTWHRSCPGSIGGSRKAAVEAARRIRREVRPGAVVVGDGRTRAALAARSRRAGVRSLDVRPA